MPAFAALESFRASVSVECLFSGIQCERDDGRVVDAITVTNGGLTGYSVSERLYPNLSVAPVRACDRGRALRWLLQRRSAAGRDNHYASPSTGALGGFVRSACLRESRTIGAVAHLVSKRMLPYGAGAI